MRVPLQYPTGAKAGAANDTSFDTFTYSRAKGCMFAEASLGGISMTADDYANKVFYGKYIYATEIVREGGPYRCSASRAHDRSSS